MEPQIIIGEIMKSHGAGCSVDEFQAAVNLQFHEFESEIYDRKHACMWDSLPRQFSLLVDDWLASDTEPPRRLRMLDIGCGTGLAPDSLMKTAAGPLIRTVDLLDTSPAMLRRAAQRAVGWGKPFTCYQGLTDAIPPESRYEIIVTCSVLHHIPDIAAFLADVARLQAPGGVFIHLQDPNGDCLTDPELQARLDQESDKEIVPAWLRRLHPSRIAGRVRRELTGKQGQDYISKINRALLQGSFITSPLSAIELFCITDIHVNDGEGISLARMREWMAGYHCLSSRSYAFWGKLESELPPPRRNQELALIDARAANGLYVGGCWKLRS
jgi:SAM-dependent methyltransferase